jgi:hypothetical protein
MPKIDKEWVIKQLVENIVQPKVGDAVISLIKVWSETEIDTPESQKEVIKIFSKLALGQPIVGQKKENEIWEPAMPGRIRVGDEVMIRTDAFTGELAPMHNGRRGRVVAVRYGDIIVNSTDGLEPELKGTHYSPMHLQKLIRK